MHELCGAQTNHRLPEGNSFMRAAMHTRCFQCDGTSTVSVRFTVGRFLKPEICEDLKDESARPGPFGQATVER